MTFTAPNPETQRKAYSRQQREMAERFADTTQRMQERIKHYDATGETDKADFFRELLTERQRR